MDVTLVIEGHIYIRKMKLNNYNIKFCLHINKHTQTHHMIILINGLDNWKLG